MKRIESWGRAHLSYSQVNPFRIPFSFQPNEAYLPTGMLRSYGDSCLNSGAHLLDMTRQDHFLEFNSTTGLLRTEAGVSLDQILRYFVPRGYFLPVSPGTKFVTVGGAIANDVHGKNHHGAGTFGCFVERFELLRTNGERLVCSREENQEMFAATIGGLGLTGVMLWAEFKLLPITNAFLDVEVIQFESLEEYVSLNEESEKDVYTVAWLDTVTPGVNRGLYIRGNHSHDSNLALAPHVEGKLSVPLDFPGFALNPWSMRLFNALYFHKQLKKYRNCVQHYDPFFYPLDGLHHWNRIYGRRGFFQYQFELPEETPLSVLQEMLDEVATAGESSFLSVLKTFGSVLSPGMLSFPRPGMTVCLDFADRRESTTNLMKRLDDKVLEAGGRLYVAKDGRQDAGMFHKTYPQWTKFLKFKDPGISSDFFRRISGNA